MSSTCPVLAWQLTKAKEQKITATNREVAAVVRLNTQQTVVEEEQTKIMMIMIDCVFVEDDGEFVHVVKMVRIVLVE